MVTPSRRGVLPSPTGSRFSSSLRSFPSSLKSFLRSNPVLLIAAALALVSVFFVPPDFLYSSYFDWKTLTCLFCTLSVICALRHIHFFTFLAERLISLSGTARRAVLSTVIITFVGSMLIANDMALLTFLPLGYHVLSASGQKKYLIFTFVMQNIGANLGGMLTPFGNPQNLYLYNRFSIPSGEFVLLMAPPFLFAVSLIVLSCFLFVKNDPISLLSESRDSLPTGRTALLLLLFSFSLVLVFRLVPFWVGLILIPLVLLFVDRGALLSVDYGLLLTFFFFFLFAGNMARIAPLHSLLSSLMAGRPLLVSLLSCQFISNVPSSILLSGFTDNYRALLYGVNCGGVGTLVSSLASLITFRQYCSLEPGGAKKYLAVFSAFSFAFLLLMSLFCYLLLL